MGFRTIQNDRLVDGEKLDNLPLDTNTELSNIGSDIVNLQSNKADKTYVDNQDSSILASANAYTDDLVALVTIPDATSLVKGKLKLAGDLGGTADNPTVPGLANKANSSDLANYVPTTRTVNNKSLNSDVTITTDDVGEGALNKYDKVIEILAGAGINVTGTYPNFTVTSTVTGDVTSVNGQTGTVVLDTDDIAEGTTHLYDKIVSITAGANVVITGTYPNFTIDSSGGGGIESIVAGTNITVDNTDPLNPIINASSIGGGQIIYDAIVAPIGGDYTTLGAAITAGKKTIYIKQGVYNETGAIQITTEGVYIQGQEKGTTILRFPTGSDGIQCYSNYSRIDNITIDTQTNGGRAAYVVGDGNIPGNPDVTKGNNNIISNCKILGPNEYGIFTVYVAGASYNAGVDTLTAYENGNLQEGNKIINCEIDGSQSGDMCSYSLQKNGGVFDSKITNGRIAFYMCKSCGVNNNDIIDSEAQGIFFALPSENCTIIGNRIVNSTLQGIKTQTQLEHSPLLAGQGAYGNVISNNTIQGAGDSGIELQDFTSSNSCIGNTIKDIGNHGIYIQGGSVIPTSKNIISNNTILNPKTNPDNTRGSGIYIVQNVIDNTIDGNEIDGTLYHTGIAIREDTSCVGNIISNNTIKGTNTERTIWIESDRTQLIGNNITGGYYAGILIKSNKNLIIGNTLRNNTNEANSVYGEIWLQNNASDNLISANYCISDATNKADYAIILSTGCNNNKVYGTKQIGSNGEVYNGGTGNEILSGTNTGDQDLSGYFNKSTDDTDDISQGNNKFVTTTQLQKIENGVMLTDTDCNTVTTGGRYGMIGTPTNGAIAGEFYLEVLSDGTRIMQVATYLTGAVYTRYYDSTWSSWTIYSDSSKVSKITSTDNAIARYNGTTGDIQNSGVIIDDSNNISANNLSGTNTGDVTLTGTPNYLTIVGQVITRALINLASHITGILPIANGGTGSSTQNFVDLTTNQTIDGTKTFSSTITGSISGNAGTATNLTSLTTTVTKLNYLTNATGTTGTDSTNIVFSTSPTLVTPILGTPTSGNLSNCTVDGTNKVGYLNIPQNSQSANYTLVLSDAGKHIYHPSADTTARTWTIPANSSVAFPIGTAITMINDTSGGAITIAITTDTLVQAGTGSTGSRTLAANGSATIIKVTSTRWQISGIGLT